jgi:hypothetical protein
MKIIFWFIIVIVLILSSFVGCTINEKPLVVEIDTLEKNPTFYVFHKSEQDVSNAIIEALGSAKSSRSGRYDGYFLFRSSTSGVFELLKDHGNLSKVYFRKDGSPYRYSPGRFEILLNSEDENETKVSINVDTPAVYTRLTMFPAPSHFVRVMKMKKVPVTTVEEYEILLLIGEELKEEDMPELKIPKKIVF